MKAMCRESGDEKSCWSVYGATRLKTAERNLQTVAQMAETKGTLWPKQPHGMVIR
jgi:hypothetical protein